MLHRSVQPCCRSVRASLLRLYCASLIRNADSCALVFFFFFFFFSRTRTHRHTFVCAHASPRVGESGGRRRFHSVTGLCWGCLLSRPRVSGPGRSEALSGGPVEAWTQSGAAGGVGFRCKGRFPQRSVDPFSGSRGLWEDGPLRGRRPLTPGDVSDGVCAVIFSLPGVSMGSDSLRLWSKPF